MAGCFIVRVGLRSHFVVFIVLFSICFLMTSVAMASNVCGWKQTYAINTSCEWVYSGWTNSCGVKSGSYIKDG